MKRKSYTASYKLDAVEKGEQAQKNGTFNQYLSSIGVTAKLWYAWRVWAKKNVSVISNIENTRVRNKRALFTKTESQVFKTHLEMLQDAEKQLILQRARIDNLERKIAEALS